MELDQLPECPLSTASMFYESFRDVDNMLQTNYDSHSSVTSEFVNVVDMDEDEPEPLEDILRKFYERPSSFIEEVKLPPLPPVARPVKTEGGNVVKIYKRKLPSEDDFDEEARPLTDKRHEDRSNGSPVPLKKRPRMYQIAYPMGHGINKVAMPLLSFTFEEEFLVMDYVVRIEEYQNRRFDFLLTNFKHYPELLVSYVNCTKMGLKVPYSKYVEKTLLKLGIEFTKSNTNTIFKDMKSLKNDVRRTVMNFTYPSLYVICFSILEGNTRERTWVDQHKKTLYTTDENHKVMEPYLGDKKNVRSISVKVSIFD